HPRGDRPFPHRPGAHAPRSAARPREPPRALPASNTCTLNIPTDPEHSDMNGHPDTDALSAFLDGEAPEVDAHVATCAECRRQLDALEQVRRAVATAVPAPPPNARDSAVTAALDAVTRPAPTRRRQWTVVIAAGAAAAAVIVGLV